MLFRWHRPPTPFLEKSPRNGEGIFKSPAWILARTNLISHSGVAGWVIHDIRRSVATGMADIGIAPHIIEAVLNHVSGHKGGVAGIYNRSSYAVRKGGGAGKVGQVRCVYCWGVTMKSSLRQGLRPLLGLCDAR